MAMIEELQAELKAILAAAFFKSQVSMRGEALEVVPSPRRHTSGHALGPCMRFALEHESSRVGREGRKTALQQVTIGA